MNGIKGFVQRTIQNDIFRNLTFIKMKDGKLGTHYICKYEKKGQGVIIASGQKPTYRVDRRRFKKGYW